ncbi:DUF6575 domain-containing protein [Segatella copri]|uniref:DUF6575 domain-containing protein n=1 Tax=Segatella copri TaxID=165179 RepID=A0AAW5IKF5_9BACT|nr:DUF6575 domain-containing protein [Segatella copri]MCP9564177.1 hypothetical protein [Segatella copri]
MNKKQSILKVDSILEYYDNPQLLTARDCFDTLYLCLLYQDTPECKYTAIRISSKRLQDFCMGKKDLRSLFLSPEGDKAYFNVRGTDNSLVLDSKISTAISEDRLPDEGYYLETSGKESIVVNIPVKDKGLFTELVRKFGWGFWQFDLFGLIVKSKMGGCSLVSTRLQPPILLYHRHHQIGEYQILVCHNLMFFLKSIFIAT